MKHFEITVYNGPYPLVHKCTTLAAAYGCLAELAGWVPGINIDLSTVMEALVDMRRGLQCSCDGFLYRIDIKDGGGVSNET